MKKYLIITADTNDADYIKSINKITDKQLNLLKPLIKAIKSNKNTYNWGDPWEDETPEEYYLEQERCSEEAFDLFQDFLPYLDNAEIHTIESIELLEVVKETKLL